MPAAGWTADPPLRLEPADPDSDQVGPKAPKRPCARCGTMFQPTVKRRMLCLGCYKDG
ncbi:MAG: hypothetical protein OXH64_12725 [Rhodospirillaceae bacterium]|nr:hypothetical protein [Rhodospirillaceae bacterium]